MDERGEIVEKRCGYTEFCNWDDRNDRSWSRWKFLLNSFPSLVRKGTHKFIFFFFLAGNKSRSVRGLERFVRELDTSQCLSTSSHTASSFNYKLPSTGTMHIFSRAHLFAPRASIVLWKYIPYIYISLSAIFHTSSLVPYSLRISGLSMHITHQANSQSLSSGEDHP